MAIKKIHRHFLKDMYLINVSEFFLPELEEDTRESSTGVEERGGGIFLSNSSQFFAIFLD
jgi:hypothetical protein